MVESLDKVLRHPNELDLAEVVRRREVLIVDGKMGHLRGRELQVMMQFLLNSLYLQREPQLPESERVQVALKVDEAHLTLNESFADAMATLRSGGLEVTAAWQYGEQIQDPKTRAGMMSLLRQRCMFSMGEESDAREMTAIGMAVYTDGILGDPESRGRLRVTPDTIFNLPNHHALCSWISQGERIPAFVAKTIPLVATSTVCGGSSGTRSRRSPPTAGTTPRRGSWRCSARSGHTGSCSRARSIAAGGAGARSARRSRPSSGWRRRGGVRRFKLQLGERGAQLRVYCLTRQGFELAQERVGRRGNYIDPGAKWREPVATDARRSARSLHVNGWVLAFEDRGRKVLRRWRGPREGRLEPPRRWVRGEWIDLLPRDIVVGANHSLRDYEPSRFEPVSPDATLELQIAMGESPLRFDLLLERDRGTSAAGSEERLRRYDGLLSSWSGMLDRYQAMGTPPVVVFVCEDERSALNLVRIADRTLTARLAKPGTEETEWPHPGRRGTFFAIEGDIHLGSLEAFQVPEFPPAMRVRLEGKRGGVHPRRVHLIEPQLLGVA